MLIHISNNVFRSVNVEDEGFYRDIAIGVTASSLIDTLEFIVGGNVDGGFVVTGLTRNVSSLLVTCVLANVSQRTRCGVLKRSSDLHAVGVTVVARETFQQAHVGPLDLSLPPPFRQRLPLHRVTPVPRHLLAFDIHPQPRQCLPSLHRCHLCLSEVGRLLLKRAHEHSALHQRFPLVFVILVILVLGLQLQPLFLRIRLVHVSRHHSILIVPIPRVEYLHHLPLLTFLLSPHLLYFVHL